MTDFYCRARGMGIEMERNLRHKSNGRVADKHNFTFVLN